MLKPVLPLKSDEGQQRLLSCSNMIIILQYLINEQMALMKDVELRHRMKQVLNNQFKQTSRLLGDIEKELSDKTKIQKIEFEQVVDHISMFYSYCMQELNKIKDPERMLECIALLQEFNKTDIEEIKTDSKP